MPKDMKTPAEMAEEIKAAHAQAFDKVKEIAESALGKAKKGEKLTNEVKEIADEALLKMNELAEQVATLEQKVARPGAADDDGEKSLGEVFIGAEDVKAWLAAHPTSGTVSLDVKAPLLSGTGSTAGSAGGAIAQDRRNEIQRLPDRRLTVRDLLAPGTTDSSNIVYPQETGFTNSAAAVAEGGLRPESDITVQQQTANVVTIGHRMSASRQLLDDASQLRSLIDHRLVYGVDFAEDAQLLAGDGLGGNISGLTTNATAFAPALSWPTPDNAIETLRLAMLQAALAEYPASGHVLNPVDWTAIEMLKDANGLFIIGQPQGSATPRLWGLPVVETQVMAAGTFLTGAFRMAAQIFDRESARVQVGYINDDFAKGMVTLLAEKRLALAIYRPEAFITGSL